MIVVLILMLAGARCPLGRWGYYPSGGLSLILAVLLVILLLLGRL